MIVGKIISIRKYGDAVIDFIQKTVGFIKNMVDTVSHAYAGYRFIVRVDSARHTLMRKRAKRAVRRFARDIKGYAFFFEILSKQFYLRAFAATVYAFKYDKFAFVHFFLSPFVYFVAT